MDYKQIIQNIQKKIFHPVYLLSGEEPYYIDIISDYIEDYALSEEEKGFNQTVLYGKDSDAQSIVQMAKRYPMMANHQVIIIKEAQDLKNIEKLIYYTEKPLQSTILVICYKYKTLPKSHKLTKSVTKAKGLVFDSPKIKEYKITSWIMQYVKEHAYSIHEETANLLGEYLGTDLHKLVNELNKLMFLLPKKSTITKQDIEKNIGISKDYNIFELQNAFGQKDVLKVHTILNNFAANPKNHPHQAIISSLFQYFKKILLLYFVSSKSNTDIAQHTGIPPYPNIINQYRGAQRKYSAKKLARIISLLREYDLKLKGVNSSSTPQEDLMKELAFKILH
ncbi:MAG: DNA polymerase III subunit delta [Bacteroidales bacterium]